MFRRLFAILFALVAALAGAVLGKVVADARRQSEAGDEMHLDMDVTALHPRDVMPGLIAALRVRDRPWSFLHIPSWLAAFSVNFAFAALSHELGPLLRTLRGESDDEDIYRVDGAPPSWTPAPSSSSAPPTMEGEYRTL
jgi:hypothetical protein